MNETEVSVVSVAAVAVAVVAFLALGPIVTIWSLNALGLAIPYSFGTWFAVSWLSALLLAGRAK